MSTIADIMTKDLKTVEPGTSVHHAAKIMKEDRIGSLFVKQAAQFSGILTDTDLVRRAMASNNDLTKMKVEEVMTSPIHTIEDYRTIGDAQEMMGDFGVRHLGVTHGGEIVGVLSARDLLVYYQRHSEPKIAQD
jgi:CBS domain-containing protein